MTRFKLQLVQAKCFHTKLNTFFSRLVVVACFPVHCQQLVLSEKTLICMPDFANVKIATGPSLFNACTAIWQGTV